MSITDLATAPSTAERPQAPPRRSAGLSWPRVALACALLAAAGGLRWYQGRRVEQIKEAGRESPFPLKSLPTTLAHGDRRWTMPEGGEGALDPEIVGYLNCADHVRRYYVDEQTGVRVEVLVLYGPGTIAHQAEVCYPGAGFRLVGGMGTQTFLGPGRDGRTPPGGPAPFHSLVFQKGEGGTAEREQVLYSLRYGGRWTTEIDYKAIARLPGMYKIQLVRRVSDRERLDAHNPCESLLEALLPEIERRIAAASRPSPTS